MNGSEVDYYSTDRRRRDRIEAYVLGTVLVLTPIVFVLLSIWAGSALS